MCASVASSSNSQKFDPTAPPPRWLDCPRKSMLIAEKFIAFKTPLDDRFKGNIDVARRWTCPMLIDSVKREQKNLGLVIDLTNTERFYQSNLEFTAKNIRYGKIRCRGHGETPNEDQVHEFIEICDQFNRSNPNGIIGVHCTHGFNRSGFMICAYLRRAFNMSIDEAIDVFAKARAPGIYKQDYLDTMLRSFGDESSATIPAPERPEWCQTNSDDEDEPNERPTGGRLNLKRPNNHNAEPPPNKRFREEPRNPNPQFAVSLPGVNAVRVQSMVTALQSKCQRMCEWNRRGFPGSQPISMDRTNYMNIVQSPYMVSWKADGTRYMMLIDGESKVYMFDRDNNVFEISYVRFPKDAECTSHLSNTLVDGELVIDKVNGVDVPRYLIYDIIFYEDEDVGKRPFRERLDLIRRSIVEVRSKAIAKGLIERNQDPFSIRMKDFWDLSAIHKLVGAKFQAQILHEVDGLIFQPEMDPYIPGRSPRVLKWKEDNTIDFRLKICEERKPQQLPEKKAYLFVNGLTAPFSTMLYSSDLRQYDNKIIECSFRNGRWVFHRQRTDKSFPNAKETAFGAIEAITHPITKEILCALIDEHSRSNPHHE